MQADPRHGASVRLGLRHPLTPPAGARRRLRRRRSRLRLKVPHPLMKPQSHRRLQRFCAKPNQAGPPNRHWFHSQADSRRLGRGAAALPIRWSPGRTDNAFERHALVLRVTGEHKTACDTVLGDEPLEECGGELDGLTRGAPDDDLPDSAPVVVQTLLGRQPERELVALQVHGRLTPHIRVDPEVSGVGASDARGVAGLVKHRTACTDSGLDRRSLRVAEPIHPSPGREPCGPDRARHLL